MKCVLARKTKKDKINLFYLETNQLRKAALSCNGKAWFIMAKRTSEKKQLEFF